MTQQGLSLVADGGVESVHAVGKLSALEEAVAARDERDGADRLRVAGHRRRRPHALGHPRPCDPGERPPALRSLGPGADRDERHRGELERAEAPPAGRRRGVQLRDRHRGRRPPDRLLPGRRPAGGGQARLLRAAGALLLRRDQLRRARPAGRRAQGDPAGGGPRRRRELLRVGGAGLPGRDPARPVPRRRRDRGHDPRRGPDLQPRRRGGRARDRGGRLGPDHRPRRAASRPSCSRRSSSSPTRSPRPWSTACAPTARST